MHRKAVLPSVSYAENFPASTQKKKKRETTSAETNMRTPFHKCKAVMQNQNKKLCFSKGGPNTRQKLLWNGIIHYIQHGTATLLHSPKAVDLPPSTWLPCKCTRTTLPRIPASKETAQSNGKVEILVSDQELAEYLIQKYWVDFSYSSPSIHQDDWGYKVGAGGRGRALQELPPTIWRKGNKKCNK